MLLGVRNKLGGTGIIAADCNTGVGSGVAEFFESRAWGCVKKEGSGAIPGVQEGAGPNEACNAAPAISDGQLFIRSDRHLWCSGK